MNKKMLSECKRELCNWKSNNTFRYHLFVLSPMQSRKQVSWRHRVIQRQHKHQLKQKVKSSGSNSDEIESLFREFQPFWATHVTTNWLCRDNLTCEIVRLTLNTKFSPVSTAALITRFTSLIRRSIIVKIMSNTHSHYQRVSLPFGAFNVNRVESTNAHGILLSQVSNLLNFPRSPRFLIDNLPSLYWNYPN